MFTKGDKVRLRHDVLLRHSQVMLSLEYCGFTTDQLKWRETLRALQGQVGTVTMVFPEPSLHVNVDFPGAAIGIDYTELELVNGESK